MIISNFSETVLGLSISQEPRTPSSRNIASRGGEGQGLDMRASLRHNGTTERKMAVSCQNILRF